MSMKISIVCPVYNAYPYIEQLIHSLELQTYNDFEVYFVNDASTDQSESILNKITDDRFFVIHNSSNLGAQTSREIGVRESSGDYVLLIDSDDYLEIDALEKIAITIKEEQSDLVIYDYKIISTDNTCLYTHYNSTPLYREQFPSNVSCHKELLLSKPGFINKCFKRSLLEQYATFVDIRVAQDLATVPIIIQHAKRVSYINESLYNYRYLKESISHAVTDKLTDTLIAIDHLRQNIKPDYQTELEFIATSHILFQLSKLHQLQNQIKRNELYHAFKTYIKKHFPAYKKNKYLRKRGIHRLVAFVFFNERLFFNPLFRKLLIIVKGNEFLNSTIYRFDK